MRATIFIIAALLDLPVRGGFMLKRSPAGNKEMNMQRRDFLNIPLRWGLPAHYHSGAARFSRLTGLPYPFPIY
jgi:hypothetical protein